MDISVSKPGITQLFKAYQSYTQEKLIKALENFDITVKQFIIQSPTAIAMTVRTLDALERADSAEKLNVLASLFVYGVEKNLIRDEPTQYQEVLALLHNLSTREIHILYHLYKGNMPVKMNDNELPANMDDVHKAMQHCSDQMNLSRSELEGYVDRLRRTGFFYKPAVWDGELVMFGPHFGRLKDLILYTIDTADLPV